MAEKVNIVMDQGATFSSIFTLRDEDGIGLDLSSFTGRSYIRKTYTSSTFYAFDVGTNANGDILLNMSANTTDSIPSGRYVYDVELVDGSGTVSRVIEGIVTVTPTVTR